MEMETKNVKQIKHDFHDHPLMFVEEQSNQNGKASCLGCLEVISGSSFGCVECNYHLHEECAQAPYKIKNHPFHRCQFRFSLESPDTYSWYACAFCKTKRSMFFYSCRICKFTLDFKCALSLLKVGENIYEFKDDGHQHPFIFLEYHKDELKNIHCSWCHISLTDSIYVSIDCKLKLHKKCFEKLPTDIDHPCHRLHSLLLQFGKRNCFCEVCQKEDDDNFFYHCFACEFDIHLECIWPKPVIEATRYHKHPFTLLFRNDSFICDACGTIGKFVSYICSTCHLQVHKNCSSLSHKIKVTRHDHVVVHKYISTKMELGNCKICFDDMKTGYGSYQCLKDGCDYVVHVKCATGDDLLYYIIDQETEDEDDATNSSITCLIEVNEHGEAIKIKHFNHEDNLLFEDKIKGYNDKHCDGCMLSMSTPFYHCSRCNFFLHKTCAELPKIKHHWFHRFTATLEAYDWKICSLCDRTCSGLFYRSVSPRKKFYFCLRCAAVPNIIRSEGHKHLLFFDYKCKRPCNGCGVNTWDGGFRCKECTFTLDFACITLPHSIQNKCDDHLMKLTYHDEFDNEDTKLYCDVCEKERDPSYWYYYCSTCDNSVHPECVLGKYPFFKDGASWVKINHRHSRDLNFVRKVDGYHYCAACCKPCQDEALKCTSCDFIIHCECDYRLLLPSEKNY